MGKLKDAKVSPIKANPWNVPGQSLYERLINVVMDRLLFPLSVLMMLFGVFVTDLVYWWSSSVPNPIFSGILLLVGLVICLLFMLKAIRTADVIKKGLRGERAVGQFLEGLRTEGAQVFHDIQAENFNLDHVVIHESGIYVIETKTMSKNTKGRSELHYDGSQVTAFGKPLSRDPVEQVKAASYWLKELLKESTGKDLPVRGVVLFPGWYVQSRVNRPSVWVLNPKAFPTYLKNEATKIRTEEVFMASFHLSKYIRSL
ncbi:nuclease-related domain-containing protein [Pseudidiomarina sp.]|uniref:nuclease-related domain-containing protein n=1 Tax=Pseudidiomarina sp. TaxID=2081707 RepID=UPI003A9727D4